MPYFILRTDVFGDEQFVTGQISFVFIRMCGKPIRKKLISFTNLSTDSDFTQISSVVSPMKLDEQDRLKWPAALE
jgi:hypothetical protein